MSVTSLRSLCAIAVSFVVAMLLRPGAAESADAVRIGVDNFGQINSNYYRGAQPDRGDFNDLKRLGIKTVIDLQEKGERDEPEWVRTAGMQFFNLRLSSTRPASAAETEYFLKLVNDPANWPVFVHCAGGRHRTGEMTAIYRISHDGWTADKAYQEMKRFKYYSFGGHGSLKDHVYGYYRDYQTALQSPGVLTGMQPPTVPATREAVGASR